MQEMVMLVALLEKYCMYSAAVDMDVGLDTSSDNGLSSSLTYPPRIRCRYHSACSASSHLHSLLTPNPPIVFPTLHIHIRNSSIYTNSSTTSYFWYGQLLPFLGVTYTLLSAGHRKKLRPSTTPTPHFDGGSLCPQDIIQKF